MEEELPQLTLTTALPGWSQAWCPNGGITCLVFWDFLGRARSLNSRPVLQQLHQGGSKATGLSL